MIYLKKNWKKSHFYFFFVKIFADLMSSIANFSNLCKEIKKLSCSVLWKRFEIKSHQRRAHYLKPCRNDRPIPTRGGSRSPPPHWLGLITIIMLMLRGVGTRGAKGQLPYQYFWSIVVKTKNTFLPYQYSRILVVCPTNILELPTPLFYRFVLKIDH